jgi:tetratricopeptide (TPR) repeat protein
LADFYEILDLHQSADAPQIRAAYKRLAMKYHPDHNPGNLQAEEMFKVINEAYHTLSDPLKKARYDSRFTSVPRYEEEVWREREARRKRYRQWQETQTKRYVFDAHYFKIQGLAFLVFIIMSGISFAIFHTANYFITAKYREEWEQSRQLVQEVNTLFGSGKVGEAIEKISTLYESKPRDLQISHARDSLVNELRRQAEQYFNMQIYDESLPLLIHLNKYEDPHREETVRKISVCQYRLGLYEDALETFSHLYAQQPWNLDLVFMIATIHMQHFNNNTEAMEYFTAGKKLFKENLTEIYGEAFTVVMNPTEVPDVYADIFIGSAELNMKFKNYREAVKDLNWAIFLRPNSAEPYKMRALAQLKVKRHENVCKDLEQAKKLGAGGITELQNKYCR